MKEYCQFETLKPQCWQREVIVIKQAFYGRRHAGRCTETEGEEIAQNPRFFGCFDDVTIGADFAGATGAIAPVVKILRGRRPRGH